NVRARPGTWRPPARAGSSRRRARSTCPTCRCSTRKAKKAPASASVAARTASACGSRVARERRSTDGGRNRDSRVAGGPAAAPAREIRERGAARADQKIRLLDADGRAAPAEDHLEHGPRQGETGQPLLRTCPGTAGDDRRPAPERAPRAQVDRLLQSPR